MPMSSKNETKPLTADQRRAAALMAAGLGRNAVAAEIGCSPKTIQRLGQREDFRELVRKQREGLLPDTPTAEATLVHALSATKPDGHPDFANRIAAARAILATPVTDAEARAEAGRVTTIFIAPESDDPEPEEDDPTPEDDGAPRPFPIHGVRGNGNGGRDA